MRPGSELGRSRGGGEFRERCAVGKLQRGVCVVRALNAAACWFDGFPPPVGAPHPEFSLSPSALSADPAAMGLPSSLCLAATLLLCDAGLLSLLDGERPSLAALGVPAGWLEAALRLLLLWGVRGLLSLAWPSPVPPEALAAVCLLPPLYCLVGPWFGDPPVLLSSAPWAWLLLGYGAVAQALVIWELLKQGGSSGGARKEDTATFWKLVRFFRPDALYVAGAFVFLILAVVGKWGLGVEGGQPSVEQGGRPWDFTIFHRAAVGALQPT